jgi:bacteriocin biosynthesis cyclodehydratase domain-containing protein
VLERVLLGDPLLHLHHALLVSRDVASAVRLPERPGLAPWCRLAEDGRRVLVEHGGTVVTFEGRAAGALLPRLLPLLDGTRTVEDIEDVLGRAAAPAIAKALALLAANRLLVDGEHRPFDDDAVTAAASFAAAVTRQTTQAAALAAIGQARVRVLGSGANAEEIGVQLRRMGIGSVAASPLDVAPGDEPFLVAAPDRDELATLSGLNAIGVERRVPWLQVLPFDGRLLVVGPLFVPGASACRQCYVLRRAACSGYDDDFDIVERVPPRAAAPTPLVSLSAALASLLVLRWLTTRDPALPGRLYAVEVGVVLRLSHDHVLRVPRCPACGTPEQAVPSPWFEATT